MAINIRNIPMSMAMNLRTRFTIFMLFSIIANDFVYGKLWFCVRGFSEGKSEVRKNATTFV